MKVKETDILLNSAKKLENSDQVPCVIFDLDDTLFDTRSRTRRILLEYIESHKVPADVSASITKMTLKDIAYFLRDTLQNIEIHDLALCKEIEIFWRERFFSGSYIIDDEVFAGCLDLVKLLEGSGIEIMYLTGRLESNDSILDMREGSKKALFNNSFPLKNDDFLMLKTERQEDDCLFKQRICRKLLNSKRYKVLASFENQPENAKMMQDVFQEARIYFHESLHRPIKVEKDYLYDKIIRFSDYHSL